ncbi:hypothetical protein DI392_18230 [Vibrio albus]|uniref:3-demethylubiquinone-9 3-methyltransferase n=1 Tax=Vibrio albus TaxID=2200953 RepID=A0A2U3B580_9VIBR|nr:hypothetical protein [Vibrio albus]PWI31963.1 hypothetical protein DI392_18230 [Vibrio albus]
MDSNVSSLKKISQLKKDFHANIQAATQRTESSSSISLLTREELSELESVWIQLCVWKQNQATAS